MPYARNGEISTGPLEGGIEINDAQYAEALQGICDGKVVSITDGFSVAAPETVAPQEPEPPTFEQLRASLLWDVDVSAEAERRKYITSGSGQAMTYMQKAAEASRFLASTSAEAEDYPLLSAEVGITAASLHDVAVVVNDSYNQWQVIGAAIEAVRLGAKAAIRATGSIEDATAVYEGISWPTGG